MQKQPQIAKAQTKSGRKNKRQWHKNIDIDDVEAGLEVMREDERTM